jgi:hypothetical protein
MKKLIKMALILAVLSLSTLYADTVGVKYLGSNGVVYNNYWAGPVSLSINGDLFSALCFDFEHTIHINDSWNAYVVDMSELSIFTLAYHYGESNWLDRYERIAWLGSQITSSNQSQWGPIQWAMWSQLSNVTINSATQVWITAANVAHTTGLPYGDWTFLFPVNEGCNTKQAFMFNGEVPEPNSIIFLSSGIMLLLIGSIKRKMITQ